MGVQAMLMKARSSGMNWTNFTAFWKFNGNINDSIGSFNLTDGNGANPITYVTGQNGVANNAAFLNDNYSSGYCSVGAGSGLQLGSGISWACGGWLKPLSPSGSTQMAIAGQYDYPFTNVAWYIRFDKNIYTYYFSYDGSTQVSYYDGRIGNWVFIVTGFDATPGAEKSWYSIDGAAKVETAHTGSYTPAKTSLFSFGVQPEGGWVAPTAVYDGWGFCKGRNLTNADLSLWYNGGSLRDYPN